MPGTLYKLFNAEGECIYIGQSMNGAQRIGSHKSQEWWPEVVGASFEHFETSDEAAEAEHAALLGEDRPKYNQRVPGPLAPPDVREARRVQRAAERQAQHEEWERTYRVREACTNCGHDWHTIAKGTARVDHVCSECGLKGIPPLDNGAEQASGVGA